MKRPRANYKPPQPVQGWKNTNGEHFNQKVVTLADLIEVGMNYTGNAINWTTLWKLIPYLEELNEIVGMEELKKSVVKIIKHYIKGIGSSPEGELMHTVLYGPPGVGKTTVAHILAKIYCNMGLLTTSRVTVADRSDFIGKFVGHSESQTMKILNESVGGVLFIDEVYSLGAGGDSDVFSKAIIDLLNKFLSEHKDMICIIAGYEKDIEENFFSVNKGLKSRFPNVFHIGEYTAPQLHKILIKKILKEKWIVKFNEHDTVSRFEKSIKRFPHFGRDVEVLFNQIKIAHTDRVFWLETGIKELTGEDISNGFDLYFKLKPEELKKELTYFI